MAIFTRDQVENIHRNVLRVLAEVGVEFAHPKLLEALAGIGAEVEAGKQRVRFPRRLVEEFIAACPKTDWAQRRAVLNASAGVYCGYYQDPETEALDPMNEQHLRDYATLARALPEIGSCSLLGCSFAPDHDLEPLYERLYKWKYGLVGGGSLYPTGAAPHLKTLFEVYAQLRGQTLADVFNGGVYLVSPLRLPAEEAAQFVWWWEQGLRPGIGHMPTGGLSTPITIAGLVTVCIAEDLAMALLRRACFGETGLYLAGMVACCDMRTMIRPFGRPEMPRANTLIAALARYYGVGCAVHAGLSDAKRPSCESGAQKAISAVAALGAGADSMVDAGLLSVDEIYSPVQLVFDAEIAGAIRRAFGPVDCSDAAIGFDAIAEAGPGGLLLAHPHTVEHFRDVLWEPTVWSRQMLATWQKSGSEDDVARARRVIREILMEAPSIVQLTADEEQALRAVIHAAARPARR